MNLFVNLVTKSGILILFDKNRQILDKFEINLLLSESEKIYEVFDNFLVKNNISYKDLENIVVVNGPGSFTGLRTIVLYINTLSYIYENIKLTPITFFDLFSNYPIIKISSKKDLFVKKSKNNIIEIINNKDFLEYKKENNLKNIYGEGNELFEVDFYIDYKKIIKKLEFLSKNMIEPFYIKKPSIN